MTTNANTVRSPKARKMEEIGSGGDLFKFENFGDSIGGVLCAKRQVRRETDGSMANLYDLRADDGKLWTIWGSAVIDSRLSQVEIGRYVEITYKSDEPAKRRGWSPTRIFTVLAESNPQP